MGGSHSARRTAHKCVKLIVLGIACALIGLGGSARGDSAAGSDGA
jgi:hypothetical protein